MIIRLVIGILALGLWSCGREEEPPGPSPSPSQDPKTPPCRGDSHVLSFGNETTVLCHQEVSRDGFFQAQNESLELIQGSTRITYGDSKAWNRMQEKWSLPDLRGLHLAGWAQIRTWVFSSPQDWNVEAEKLLSNAVDFCRERQLDLKQVQELASKVQRPKTRAFLLPKERIYAFMTAAVLLDARRAENAFYLNRKDFLDTVFQNINDGKLRILDYNKNGVSEDLFRKALYSLSTNTLAISEVGLDLKNPQARAIFIHELYHFFQDSRRESLSLVETEVQAHLAEAEYTLREEKLLHKPHTAKELEAYILSHNVTPESNDISTDLAALRVVFFQSLGDTVRSRKWLEICRERAEIVKIKGGLLEIMRGPTGPGKPGSAPTRFVRENAEAFKKDPKILDPEIKRLQQEKTNEIARLKVLLSAKPINKEALIAQLYHTLQKSLDLFLFEILKMKHSGKGEALFEEKLLTNAARELARFKVSQILLSSTDGVDF